MVHTIHNLCTACPVPMHTFIHNMLWCRRGTDTNSSFLARHVNKQSESFPVFFGARKKLKLNQSFYRARRLKNKHGNGWMRAGAAYRPTRPVNTLNLSVLASMDMPCSAQKLLHSYVLAVKSRKQTSPASRACFNAAIRPGRCRPGNAYFSGWATGATAAGNGIAVGAEVTGTGTEAVGAGVAGPAKRGLPAAARACCS